MRRTRDIGGSGAPAGAPLSGLAANDSHVSTRLSTNSRSITRNSTFDADAVEGAAGLASPPGLSSPAVAFEVAAVLCGHNIESELGKANARADYKVWDLVERMRP